MLIDITLKLTPKTVSEDDNKNPALVGHLGTHFDVMECEFPLEYTNRRGIVFNVSEVGDRDICTEDIDLDGVEVGMFAAFYTGYGEKEPYGTKAYYSFHPQLSDELISALIEKGVSIIGIDCAGIRRGKEHVPADRRCAEMGTFVIENLVSLDKILEKGKYFTAHTYPMNFSGITGLPCRVIAEI